MKHRAVVLLTDPIDEVVTADLALDMTVRLASATDGISLRREARSASFVVVRAPLPPELFEESPLLRGVVRHGAGLDMIPVEAASRHGVAVANVPAVNAVSVAEYAIGQMLALARRLPQINRALHDGSWAEAREWANDATDLQGKTLVIVGMGAIGQALARIGALGFGMSVVGVRRTSVSGGVLVRHLPLDQALPLADYLVLACPLTDATRGLIDAHRLALLKPGARLVNVSRGPVVDEAALIAALQSGHLAGAALDVFATQPLPTGSPLRQMPQVMLSPHLAGLTRESMCRMSEGVAAQLRQMLANGLPTHLVNPEAREAILARWSSLNARP